MADRERKPGFVMSNEHRVKIQNSNILNALIEHVEGKRKMSSTQVTAGLGMLRKVMPDLALAADLSEGANYAKSSLRPSAEDRCAGVAETPPSLDKLN